MDEILTVSTINPLLNHVPLPEKMDETLPNVLSSSPKSSDTDVKFDLSQSPQTAEEYTTHPSSETKEKFTTLPPQEGKAENTTIPSSETGVKLNFSQSPQTEEEYTTHPSSEATNRFTNPTPPEDKTENTTTTSSEIAVEFNTDPSEIGINCTTPLSHETKVEFVSQNAQFASKDIRYEKTAMQKLKQHTNEPRKVVKKKV